VFDIGLPNQKQLEFFKARERFIAYGGARGGGKSWAVRKKAAGLALTYPGIKILLLRRTFPELRDNHIRPITAELKGIAVYKESDKTVSFPNGSLLRFGYCDSENDVQQYQGQEFDIIFLDEATQFTEYQFMTLTACMRGANSFPKRFYLTCNPGGVGHGWVKRLFVDRAFRGTEVPEEYRFISATVDDNRALLDADPNYVKLLDNLPPGLKEAWRYGRWDIFKGQVFTEWRNDPGHYADGLWTHVIDPFPIPAHWRIWRGFDFGYAKPFSVGWYAADEDGRLYRIREFYGCTEDNVGVKLTPQEIAAQIKTIEEEDAVLRGRSISGVADPSIFDESRGQSVARMMAAAPNRVYWQPGDNTRLPGKMQFHYRFAFDREGRPMFQCFSTCKHFIRTIPVLCYDERKAEDINTAMEDHIYDECRYVLMENPMSPPLERVEEPPSSDPLNLWEDAHKGKKAVRQFRI
jgi:hypothetical protein